MVYMCAKIIIFPLILDITNLDDVMKELSSQHFPSSEWFKLGIQLGLHYNTLKAIESNYSKDCDRCLYECIAAWLMKKDNVKGKGEPSLDTLIDALKDMELTK